MLNEYQLVARRSMVRADHRDFAGAAYDGARVREMFEALNEWTRRYNEDVCNGKWKEFFNWRPYHQYWSETLDVPYFTFLPLHRVLFLPMRLYLPMVFQYFVKPTAKFLYG